MAGHFLKAAAVSEEKTEETLRLVARQIQVTMFMVGAGTIDQLAKTPLKQS
jgi:isopentenyl diphosphate isomerase/L-lactate dehydrogenase-like FMN-dependent dehydrogenase